MSRVSATIRTITASVAANFKTSNRFIRPASTWFARNAGATKSDNDVFAAAGLEKQQASSGQILTPENILGEKHVCTHERGCAEKGHHTTIKDTVFDHLIWAGTYAPKSDKCDACHSEVGTYGLSDEHLSSLKSLRIKDGDIF
ncbi:MAG: hypothetical protein V1822_02005 [Candidatus Micrarchaeota archaeon]